MTTLEKFSSVLPLLWDAIDRQITLDIEYPAVYNRVNRHYEERGVSFYGICNPSEIFTHNKKSFGHIIAIKMSSVKESISSI